jgi:signal transduction histidine kinase
MLAIFLPAALLTGAVVIALYYLDLAKEHTLFSQSADHLVDLQTDIIDRELHAVESDLRYLAGQAVLRNYLSGSGANKKVLEEEYVLLCKERGVYDQIRYLDANGMERIRINNNDGGPTIVPENELQSKANRYYFTKTLSLKPSEVFVSPLDLNVEHDEIERPLKPVIRFATPIVDKLGAKRGVLILNYLGQGLIQKLAAVSESFPGSAWLLNREGNFLRGPTAADEWGSMLKHARRFATYFPVEWASVVSSNHGQIQTDRGLFSYQTLFPPEKLPATGSTLTSSEDQDIADAGLIVVTHISPSDLNFRARLLLRRMLLLWGVVLVLILVLAWYLAKAGAHRSSQERHIAESEVRLRTLSSQLITAQEDERRRLSRDLHDELGQIVTAVSLDLQRAAQASPAAKKDELIGQASHGAACLLDKIHEISLRIRPTLLDDLGLKDAVQSLLSDYERRTGIVTRSKLQFDRSDIPAQTSENIFRILQEALTNVSKHSQAKEVSVKLTVTDRQTCLVVQDMGAGFTLSQVNGKELGLLGMRERA